MCSASRRRPTWLSKAFNVVSVPGNSPELTQDILGLNVYGFCGFPMPAYYLKGIAPPYIQFV